MFTQVGTGIIVGHLCSGPVGDLGILLVLDPHQDFPVVLAARLDVLTPLDPLDVFAVLGNSTPGGIKG